MGKVYDICILSAFGRHEWMAKEFTASGMKVLYVDMSTRLGRWTPEDWEGPFGVFESKDLKASQYADLFDSYQPEQLERGFTVWGQDKTIEFKGPLNRFQLESTKLLTQTEEFLTLNDSVDLKKEKMEEVGFESSWLGKLAHHFASHQSRSSYESVGKHWPLPFLENYYIRRPHRSTPQAKAAEMERMGIRVISSSSVKDIRIDSKKVSGVEVEVGGITEYIQSNKFVWGLSPEETEFINENICKSIYRSEIPKHEWVWIRYRAHFKSNPMLDALPSQFLLIEKLNFPWAHENFIQCLRSIADNEFDCWMRIPASLRFRREYLSNMKDNLKKVLSSKLPGLQIEDISYPQEYSYAFEDLGPARFGNYDFPKRDRTKIYQNTKNIYFDDPYQWNRMDVLYRLLRQNKTFSHIKKEWEKTSDRSIHQTRDGKSLDA
ncbi:MAG: hypothetical protein AB8E15_01715 [Bdellovibrionales bacterium]